MSESKPVVSGEELIKLFTRLSIRNGVTGIFEVIRSENGALVTFEELGKLKGKLVVDCVWLLEQLKNFPKERDFMTTTNVGSFRPLDLIIAIYKWKEDFEKELFEK